MILDNILLRIDRIIGKMKVADRLHAFYAILLFLAFLISIIAYTVTTPDVRHAIIHFIMGWRH